MSKEKSNIDNYLCTKIVRRNENKCDLITILIKKCFSNFVDDNRKRGRNR